MQEEHDLPDLHALLPGSGDPFTSFGTDAIDRLQVGGVVADDTQHFGTEVFHQLFRKYGSNALYETTAEVPFNSLARGRRGGLQDLSLELEPMLLISYPPTLSGHPFPGAHCRHGTKDCNQIPLSADLHP